MEKLKRVREALTEVGADGILITSTYNRRYVSNFTGSSGAVLISGERLYL